MKTRLIPALGTVVAFALYNAQAIAAPATAHWSTFLHSGPGETYPVLAEVEHDEALDVGDCQRRWCKVSQGRITGFVDRDALTLAQPAADAAPPKGASCFTAALTSYPGPTPRRFCEIPKTPAAP
jgi:uncharacterized protein YraI